MTGAGAAAAEGTARGRTGFAAATDEATGAAGSGHIAGVVNPPAAGKYQYWTNPGEAASLEAFMAGASETRGSWWPDWRAWLAGIDAATVPAQGARVPGAGAIEPAPGRYVRMR